MPDHNSLTKAMYALQKAFLTDASNLTGYDTSKDKSTCSRVLGQGSRRGLLQFLEKHHLVLLEYAKTSTVRAAAVKHDATGLPVFMNPLWRDLTSEDAKVAIRAFSLLRQATCLFRKWAEDEVLDDNGVTNFVARMGCQKAHCAEIVALVSEHIAKIIGNEDLTPCERTFPVITSGARAEKTPVLRRVDSIRFSPLSERFRADGFRIVQTKQPNRLVSVPKDWTKNRLVFAEPSDGMNLQQALRLWLEERASSSKHLSFESQDYQRLSLSNEGRSSIDLSDASDHLTSAVVWQCFKKHPVLRAALFCARSSRTMGPDGPVVLTCFGTMGNATTFTVMSIVIAAAASAAEAHYRWYTGVRPRATTVFGDDVVCDDGVAGTMLEFLRGLGLVPNPRKTFIACAFRESCGLDLFRDVDVTPIYVKHVAITRRDDLIRCVEQANALHARGLWNTAAELVALSGYRFAVGLGPGSLTTFSNGQMENQPGAVWSEEYQRWVPRLLRGVRVKVKDRDSSLDLAYSLFHGFRVRETAPSGA